MENDESLRMIITQEYPGYEYKHLGVFWGNIVTVLRLSLGDFSILEDVGSQERYQSVLFWGIWLLTVITTSLIFLNFIVAEAQNSYNRVISNIRKIIYKQKALMTNETELMTFKKLKDPQIMPKYLIIKEII